MHSVIKKYTCSLDDDAFKIIDIFLRFYVLRRLSLCFHDWISHDIYELITDSENLAYNILFEKFILQYCTSIPSSTLIQSVSFFRFALLQSLWWNFNRDKARHQISINSQEHVTLLVWNWFFSHDALVNLISRYVSGKCLAHWINRIVIDTILTYILHTNAICKTLRH